MSQLRALPAFLLALLFTPALALAQLSEPLLPPEPYEPAPWGASWLWIPVLAVTLLALLAWSLSRDSYRRGPPLAP